jgi:hypothetical protein
MIPFALIAVFAAAPILAQGKAPVEAKPASVALTATVKSVSGIVEKFSGDAKNGKWQPLKAGDVLAERSLVRTGLGGRAVLKFADRGDVTVKSGTKIGISSFRRTGKLVKTRLGLKYGALRAQVDSSRGKNDFRVRTASATLAATGTSGNVAQWGDFALQFQGTTGTWRAKTQKKITSIRPGEWTNRKASRSIGIVLNKLDTKVGDPHGGLTKAETVQLQMNRGAIKPITSKGPATATVRRRSRRNAVVRRLRILRDRVLND